MKILSWNINGLRAVIRKKNLEDVLNLDYDVYCFQETKINQETLPKDLETKYNFNKSWSFSDIKKGYSGVSNWSKNEPLNTKNFNIKKFDQEGRILVQEYENFYLINGYFPNGQGTHIRVPYKLEFSYKVLELAKKLEKKKGVIICGDINTAHTEIDLSNPKSNKNTTGFLPIERKFIDDLINDGFIDCFRYLNPNKKEQYSWWSYRTAARKRNVGWRIDYFFISEKLKDKLVDCYYLDEILGSDHCPIVLELDF